MALPKSSSMSGSLLGVCQGLAEDPGSGDSEEVISVESLSVDITILGLLDTVVEVGLLLVTCNVIQVEELDLSQRNNDLIRTRLGHWDSHTPHKTPPSVDCDQFPWLSKSMSASIP